jgi:hypothetical protein
MTLTQRLTRAGATFIILGAAALLIPQNDAAQATTATSSCAKTNPFYRLTTNPSPFSDTVGATVAINTSVVVYAASSSDGTNYTATTASFSYSDPKGTVTPTSGISTSVSSPAVGDYTLTGTFPGNITLGYPITVQ